jgi:hypothetical protein
MYFYPQTVDLVPNGSKSVYRAGNLVSVVSERDINMM